MEVVAVFLTGFVLGQAMIVLWVMSTLQEDEEDEIEEEAIEAGTEGSVVERRDDTRELDKSVRNSVGLHCDQEGNQRKETGREVVASVVKEEM